MKVALLADVHGNLPALQAVLAHAGQRGVDEIWNLGDMVGYGPYPEECVALLRQVCRYNLAGNHDYRALAPCPVTKLLAKAKDPDKVFSFHWSYHAISPVCRKFIRSLPHSLSIRVGTVDLMLTHASPLGADRGIDPEATRKELADIAATIDQEYVFCGHTHQAFDRKAGGVRFINPGCVGRSFDGDPRASFCVLEFSPGRVTVKFIRVAYDLSVLERRMHELEFPARVITAIVRGRGMDDLDEEIAMAGRASLTAAAGAMVRSSDEEHVRQVVFLAEELFDGLRRRLELSARDRELLLCAAFLHDAGEAVSDRQHHKVSRDIILSDRTLPLTWTERVAAALVARYHRGVLPHGGHKYFRGLKPGQQARVERLAALLRLADGLDRAHNSEVRKVELKITQRKVTIMVAPARGKIISAAALCYGRIKSDLLARCLGIRVEVVSENK